MSLFWLNPFAWTGLALVALPILIHLLARRRSQRVLFPSLRFLPTSERAALRRRALEDRPLLLVRALIVFAAVAAAAAPVFVADARRAAWQQRTARAIITTHDSPDVRVLADEEAATAFTSTQFAESRVADSLRSASLWLRTPPPAAREVVIIGRLREGALARTDLSVLEPHVGIRFLPVDTPHAAGASVRAVADVDGQLAATRIEIAALPQHTAASYVVDATGALPALRLEAAPADQQYADALLRAVLREGVMVSTGGTRALTIAFNGAPERGSVTVAGESWMRRVLELHPDISGGAVDGVLYVRAAMPVTDARAPQLVWRVVQSTFAPALRELEPRTINAATLAAWSRVSGPLPPITVPPDEGDHRWFWGLALALLAVEQLMRQRQRRPNA